MERQSSTISSNGGSSSKVKLLCSYGGKIHPRPSDHQLSYVGGDTKILAVDPAVKFSEIMARLTGLASRSDSSDLSIKYQLPGEDLDSLVSLINDEDVEHMMVEYARMQRISAKPARIRIFVFERTAPPAKSPGMDPPFNPDYLFGFDKEYRPSVGPPVDLLQIPGMFEETVGKMGPVAVHRRFPAVGNGGVQCVGPACMMSDSREQAVYGFVPIMPSVPGGGSQPVRVNQGNF